MTKTKVYQFLFFGILFIQMTVGCNSPILDSAGIYQIRSYSNLEKTFTDISSYKETGWPTSWQFSSSENIQSLDEYLSKQEEKPLALPVLEVKKTNEYEDWGIYSKKGNTEDTVFYAFIKPKLAKVGEPGNEYWVVESIDCSWKKSKNLSECNLYPIAKLDYKISLAKSLLSQVTLQINVKAAGEHWKLHGIGTWESKDGNLEFWGWHQKLISPDIMNKQVEEKVRANGEIRVKGERI